MDLYRIWQWLDIWGLLYPNGWYFTAKSRKTPNIRPHYYGRFIERLEETGQVGYPNLMRTYILSPAKFPDVGYGIARIYCLIKAKRIVTGTVPSYRCWGGERAL